MLHLLFTLGLALAPNVSSTGQDAIEALEAAVEAGRPVRTVRALAVTGEIEDPRVVKACFEALAVESPRVRLAAVEALRFNPHPGALQALHSRLHQGAMSADPAVEVAVVRALGQHASDKSLPLLSRGALDPERPVLGRARLLSLGRIGTQGAVDALIALASALPDDQRLLFADELRLALQRATGADHGFDVEAWSRWWMDARSGFEPASAEGEAPLLCTLEWNEYWTSRAALSSPAPEPVALPREQAQRGQPVEASAKPRAEAGQGDAAGKPKGDAAGKPKGDAAGAGPVKPGPQGVQGGAGSGSAGE